MRIRQWLSRGVLRVPKLAGAAVAITGVLVCMAMALMHLSVTAFANGQFDGVSLIAQVAGGVAMMFVAGWVILKCEQEWTKPAKLDWASFRRHGWSWSRTVIVALSVLLTAVPLSKLNLVGMGSAELSVVLVVAAGYAMWCATGLAVLWALARSTGGPGWPLQGSPVPLVPYRPRLAERRALVPA